jgi:hypothetical protein
MLHHYSKWEQSNLNKRQYCDQENISYLSFCKYCSRQNESSGVSLLKPESTKLAKAFRVASIPAGTIIIEWSFDHIITKKSHR